MSAHYSKLLARLEKCDSNVIHMNKLKYNKRAAGIVIFGLVCLGVSAGIFLTVDFDSLATTDNDAPIGFLYCFLAVIFVAGLLLTTFRSGSIIDKQHN